MQVWLIQENYCWLVKVTDIDRMVQSRVHWRLVLDDGLCSAWS